MKKLGRFSTPYGAAPVSGIERRQSRVLIGSDAKVISLVARLLPVSYWKLLALRAGR